MSVHFHLWLKKAATSCLHSVASYSKEPPLFLSSLLSRRFSLCRRFCCPLSFSLSPCRFYFFFFLSSPFVARVQPSFSLACRRLVSPR